MEKICLRSQVLGAVGLGKGGMGTLYSRRRLTHKDIHGVFGTLFRPGEIVDVTRGGPPVIAVCGAYSCKDAADPQLLGPKDATDTVA